MYQGLHDGAHISSCETKETTQASVTANPSQTSDDTHAHPHTHTHTHTHPHTHTHTHTHTHITCMHKCHMLGDGMEQLKIKIKWLKIKFNTGASSLAESADVM